MSKHCIDCADGTVASSTQKIRLKIKENILLYSCGILFLVYLISVFVINFSGRAAASYDIYSDAMLAKHIVESGSIFPADWTFGNQIYVVATPVLAAPFYALVQDTYIALSLASCVMTVLCLASFIWCTRPFVKKRDFLIGLLILIGGLTISSSAYTDLNGPQVFYTMASYYACYMIGIFFTMGIYLRYLYDMPVKIDVAIIALVLNFALGMQSLREMLVLNLPLCALAVLGILLAKKPNKEAWAKKRKSGIFALAALVANGLGYVFTKFLIAQGAIHQNDILKNSSTNILTNVLKSIEALLEYIGVVKPNGVFPLFRLLVAAFSVAIVLAALVQAGIRIVKSKKVTGLEALMVFFVISLCAVFAAGILVIELRSLYFFCWLFLVACSVMYLMDVTIQSKYKDLFERLKKLAILVIICISIANYAGSFGFRFFEMRKDEACYNGIVAQLEEEGITHLYSDWRTNRNQLGAVARDRIVYGTLEFSNDPQDLWRPIDYLYSSQWFAEENYANAYIVLSDLTLEMLDTELSEEYKNEFMNNLELVHAFDTPQGNLYFYKGSEKMFADMDG